MYKVQSDLANQRGSLVKFRPISWYERIKTGPSPDDPALLSLTRELSTVTNSKYWYRQIVWGRFLHGGAGGLISMPVMSRETLLAPPAILTADLMLPEYLKGKLSMEEWKILIGMHLVKLKGYESKAMNRIMVGVPLILFGIWIPVLILAGVFLPRSIHDILSFSALGLSGLLALFWARRRVRPLDLEFDRQAAAKFGAEQLVHVLEKMRDLQSGLPRSMTDRVSDYWNPSFAERIARLGEL